MPGGGTVVRLARATWDTGWFQAEVAAQLLTELGFIVEGPVTTDTGDFYDQVHAGDVDLWVNGWFPLHNDFMQDRPDAGAARAVGAEVRGGALQGYMIDSASIAEFDITTLADLARPEVAAHFDADGDGLADLIGCNDDWACRPIVEHHIAEYGLAGTVEQVSDDYGLLMRNAVDRYRRGEPVLFYTFTPNWTVGSLVPGRDVAWVPVPHTSLPPGQEGSTVLESIPGCVTNPCNLGFPPNDIQAVANTEFLDANPAVGALLEQFSIPLNDILDQNARMIAGFDSADDIESQAGHWIASHRSLVDDWIAGAVEAHLAAGGVLAPLPDTGRGSGDDLGRLRVVAKPAAPFVTYENGRYRGFSVELLELLAADLGADLEFYAVNSSAKVVDDLNRGVADLGAGALAITSQRERRVDFSQPYFDSGLQILVAQDRGGLFGGRIGAVLDAIFSRDLLILLLFLLGILIVAAHVIWLSERRTNPEFPESYVEGIWESLWWAAVTATTVGYGDKTPKGKAGRIFGLIWMFSGLLVLAYFTAGIAATFAIDELQGNISGPDDLRGHVIGIPADSTAGDYLARQGIAAERFVTADAAYAALRDGAVDAVVHDAAILQHFVALDATNDFEIAGLVFAERGFGFALPAESELTERLNRALLESVESGAYSRLYETWFGDASEANR